MVPFTTYVLAVILAKTNGRVLIGRKDWGGATFGAPPLIRVMTRSTIGGRAVLGQLVAFGVRRACQEERMPLDGILFLLDGREYKDGYDHYSGYRALGIRGCGPLVVGSCQLQWK